MSIIHLVNNSLRPEIHRAAPNLPLNIGPDALIEAAAQSDSGGQGNQIDNAISTLTGYLPTESITLYIAALAIVPALNALNSIFTKAPPLNALASMVFTVLTPVLFLLIYVAKRRSAGLPRLPGSIKEYPWWGMFAATVAFLAWAVAVPESPYLTSNEGRVVAGFLALFISTALSRLEPVFGPQQPASS